jgi:hypothetical protein
VDSEFDSQHEQRIYLFFITTRPALGPDQPPVQLAPGIVSPGVRGQGHEADRSPHPMSRLRMMELYLHFPIRIHGVVFTQLGPRINLLLYSTVHGGILADLLFFQREHEKKNKEV